MKKYLFTPENGEKLVRTHELSVGDDVHIIEDHLDSKFNGVMAKTVYWSGGTDGCMAVKVPAKLENGHTVYIERTLRTIKSKVELWRE